MLHLTNVTTSWKARTVKWSVAETKLTNEVINNKGSAADFHLLKISGKGFKCTLGFICAEYEESTLRSVCILNVMNQFPEV